jgi:hypothetical protein
LRDDNFTVEAWGGERFSSFTKALVVLPIEAIASLFGVGCLFGGLYFFVDSLFRFALKAGLRERNRAAFWPAGFNPSRKFLRDGSPHVPFKRREVW